ncbi:MAG: cytochrome c oxidase subunit II [Candidatus Marinimicrobia bacterium]|nr:cytochrome c oxidase subunit II [Candidatus Neomarinimicrobiota bacterium]MCF7903880.1 cytochrome c oxidase subunit II [Candidatus Neomarinimicrobiota bacterium]
MNGATSVFVSDVDFSFWLIFIISALCLVGITGFVIFSIIKYNRKNNPEPTHIEGHTGLEIVWTVIPTILVMFIFYFGMKGFIKMRSVPENAMEIQVDAGMWWWKFTYPNGLEQTTGQGLTVPVDTPIYLPLHSVDVIHSFYIPAFRVKMDVVPKAEGEKLNYTWFEAGKPGDYDLFCAEYCGLNHAQMLSKVHVLSQEDYDAWFAEASKAQAKLKSESPGKALLISKGCIACHSTDGSKLIGPSLKGLIGKTETVLTDGAERTITVDDTYLRRSLNEPAADIVKGFQPLMPPLPLTPQEVDDLIQYIHELSEETAE